MAPNRLPISWRRHFRKGRLVVLIDESSASASEIVSELSKIGTEVHLSAPLVWQRLGTTTLPLRRLCDLTNRGTLLYPYR
ncbi:MAG: hypothetical protein IPN94_09765 [Sphingobacteriales bacterium]|nr:hypothetical protein [Sphingobacteriales bacterium]